MESPESGNATSPADQVSPSFSYINGFSPLKPVNAVHPIPAFGDTNVPSPSPVFTSPHINLPRNINILKRTQYPYFDNVEKLDFGCVGSNSVLSESAEHLAACFPKSIVQLSPSSWKGSDYENSTQVQPYSPPGCVDDFLLSPTEELLNSSGLSDCCLNQAAEEPQVSRGKKCVDPVHTGDSVKLTDKTEGENVYSVECPRPKPEDAKYRTMLSILPASSTQLGPNSIDQIAIANPPLTSNQKWLGTPYNPGKENHVVPLGHCLNGTGEVNMHPHESGEIGECYHKSQLHPESFQNAHANNSCYQNSGAISNKFAVNKISSDGKEVCQHQQSMRRRLGFEAAEIDHMSIGCNRSSDAESSVCPKGLNFLNGSMTTSNNKEFTQPSMFCGPASYKYGNSSVTATGPSSIGLHLNSVGNATTRSCNVQLAENDCLDAQVEKSISGSNHQVPEDSKSCLALMLVTGNTVTEGSDSSLAYADDENHSENQQQSQALILANCPTPLSVNPLNNSLQSKHIDQCITGCDMRKSPPDNSSRFEKLTEMSPKKKRKKMPENEGCKHCNCKKSKCLKLYCECFAAGFYCSGLCTCTNCLNNSDHVDEVRKARQKIESHNPHAFAPKVVVDHIETPKTIGDDSEHATPAPARHLRGCNCKKSQCFKRYCECYQAGVGCSYGCRCERCKNTYGIKGGCIEYSEIEHKKDENVINSSRGTESVELRIEYLNNEKSILHMSPHTPLLDGSYDINDMPGAQYLVRGFHASPLSGVSFDSSYRKSPCSPRTSVCNSRFFKENEGSSSIASHDPKVDSQGGGAKFDSSSSRQVKYKDRCEVSALQILTPYTGYQAVSDPRKHTSSSGAQFFQRKGRQSVSFRRCRSSPVTPMPQFGESKAALEPDSDTGILNVCEDDTPEILKDTHSHIMPIKLSSPNKKRVSPPHKHLLGLSSSSSPSLRNRKAILQSVPPFPSLTPYGNNDRGHGT